MNETISRGSAPGRERQASGPNPAQATGADPDFSPVLKMLREHPEIAASIWEGRTDRIGIWNGKPQSVEVDQAGFHSALRDHFSGKQRVGIYNLMPDARVAWGCIDFDSHNRPDLASSMETLSRTVQEVLIEAGTVCWREISKRGAGNFHLWIHLEELVSAAWLRQTLRAIVGRTIEELGIEGIPLPEIFPKGDQGLGNFVWLPLFGPDIAQGRTIYIDPSGKPIVPDFGKTWFATLQSLKDLLAEHRITLEQDNAKPAPLNEYALLLEEDIPEGQRHNRLVKLLGHYKHRLGPGELLPFARVWNRGLSSPLPAEEIEATVRSMKMPQTITYSNGEQMMEEELPEATDLIRGLFREKSFNILAGEEGCGKSLLATDLGLCVATGAGHFLGWEVAKSGPIVYLNMELHREDFVRRFQAKAQLKPGPGPLENFILPDGISDLEAGMPSIRKIIEEHQAILLIVDCLYFAHNRDEGSSNEMKELVRGLLALRDEYGIAVLVIHHFRKGSRYELLNSEMMRGSGVFGQSTDAILMMRKSQTQEGKRYIKPTKLRHHLDSDNQARLLSIDPVSLIVRDEGVTNEADHIGHPESTEAAATIPWAEVMGDGEKTTAEILEALRPMGYRDRTVKLALAKASAPGGPLIRARHGVYRLRE